MTIEDLMTIVDQLSRPERIKLRDQITESITRDRPKRPQYTLTTTHGTFIGYSPWIAASLVEGITVLEGWQRLDRGEWKQEMLTQ